MQMQQVSAAPRHGESASQRKSSSRRAMIDEGSTGM